MFQAPSFITSAATTLAARRRGGEQGPRLPEWCRPLDLDTALAIQAAVTGQEIAIRYGALGELTVRFA